MSRSQEMIIVFYSTQIFKDKMSQQVLCQIKLINLSRINWKWNLYLVAQANIGQCSSDHQVEWNNWSKKLIANIWSSVQELVRLGKVRLG
jgi:hypothetical protein